MRPFLSVALLAGALAVGGCEALSALGLGAPAVGSYSAGAPKVKLNGTVYASATQVAIVAAGGGNYQVQASSGEAPLGGATVRVSPLTQPSVTIPGQTDGSGRFVLEVSSGAAYKVTADKAGGKKPVSLVGIAFVGTSDTSFELDTATCLVSAKVLTLGKSAPDPGRFQAAVGALRGELGDVSKIAAAGQAEAAATFDAKASDTTKALVQGL